MPYPPPVPPATRTNATPMVNNHAGDHDMISSALTEILNHIATLETVLGPIGHMTMWPGSGLPTNYLFCRGQAVSRVDYLEVFTIIGTTYGAGDGATTFNLPAMQGRSPMGYWPSGVWAPTLGQFAGQQDSTLPVHSHGPGGTGRTGFENQNHTHNAGFVNNFLVSTLAGQGTGDSFGGYLAGVVPSTSIEEQAHDHNVPATANAGSAPTNTNIHPVVVVNFIIRMK